MTIEQLEKAKEIQSKIVHKKEQLRLIEKSKEYNRGATRSISVSNYYISIPKSIEDIIFLLVENEYKKDIENLEKKLDDL